MLITLDDMLGDILDAYRDSGMLGPGLVYNSGTYCVREVGVGLKQDMCSAIILRMSLRDISPKDLSIQSGISRSSVNKILVQDVSHVSYKTLFHVIESLGLDMEISIKGMTKIDCKLPMS